MAIKTKIKATKVVTSSKAPKEKTKAKPEVSEREELIVSETETAVEMIGEWKNAETEAQSKFLEIVRHYREVKEENDLSDLELTDILRNAYAEIHNEANPKDQIEAKDLAGKEGQENYGSLVTELKRIKRFVFPADKKAKAFERHLTERLEGKADYTIGSLYQEAQGMADAQVAGKKGRKVGSKKGAGKGAGKGKSESITDLEVALTEFSVTLSKCDWDEVDLDEVEEGIANLISETREKLEASE